MADDTIHFFLSYARLDDQVEEVSLVRALWDAIVAEIKGAKGASHTSAFLDRTLSAGDDLKVIADAIAETNVFVVLSSPTYFEREACAREWAMFEKRVELCKAPESPLILLRWTDFAVEDLPVVVRVKLLSFDGVFDQSDDERRESIQKYNDYGLRWVVQHRAHPDYRLHFANLVRIIAKRIIEFAKKRPLGQLNVEKIREAAPIFDVLAGPVPLATSRALVVGIDEHLNGRPANTELGPNQFPDLEMSKKDAEVFADVLKTAGIVDGRITLLRDKDATLGNIRTELDDLRRHCSSGKNPLIVVYFSCHGMVDDEKRHYLVPYDADRSRLFGTALLNESLNRLLEAIETDKLVVFLDACHSGGIGRQGVKNAAFGSYEPLFSGSEIHVVASCGPTESSYELDQNSIFTSELVSALRFDGPDQNRADYELYELVQALRERVPKVAKKNIDESAKQTPVSSVREPTNIVLVRNKKKGDKSRAIALVAELGKTRLKTKNPSLFQFLASYVHKGKRPQAQDDLFNLFDYYVLNWSGDPRDLDTCVEQLLDSFDLAQATPSMQEQKVADGYEAQARPSLYQATARSSVADRYPVDVAGHVTRSVATLPGRVSAPILAKKLPKEIQDRLLEKLRGYVQEFPQYFAELGRLADLFTQPVLYEEVERELRSRPADPMLSGLYADVLQRLKEFLDAMPERP